MISGSCGMGSFSPLESFKLQWAEARQHCHRSDDFTSGSRCPAVVDAKYLHPTPNRSRVWQWPKQKLKDGSMSNEPDRNKTRGLSLIMLQPFFKILILISEPEVAGEALAQCSVPQCSWTVVQSLTDNTDWQQSNLSSSLWERTSESRKCRNRPSPDSESSQGGSVSLWGPGLHWGLGPIFTNLESCC